MVSTRAYGAGRSPKVFLHQLLVSLQAQANGVVCFKLSSLESCFFFTASLNLLFNLLQNTVSARSCPRHAIIICPNLPTSGELCLVALKNICISLRAAPVGSSFTISFLVLCSRCKYAAITPSLDAPGALLNNRLQVNGKYLLRLAHVSAWASVWVACFTHCFSLLAVVGWSSFLASCNIVRKQVQYSNTSTELSTMQHSSKALLYMMSCRGHKLSSQLLPVL